MQTQNIWPIPNDDEWPLATVFDVKAKLVLFHQNDIFVSRRRQTLIWNVLGQKTIHITNMTNSNYILSENLLCKVVANVCSLR